MADYDVGVTGLSVPPASAVVQQYRPAVSVRNNGVHPALASGYIRIYSAGQLIETFEVFSGSIPPGESRDAQTVEYWTPPAVGRYLFNGYITCDKDQVEPNNNLPPTYITVTAAPPPPTPPVTIHAAQHEEGGADEVNIDGLQGKTADLQDPTTHGNDAHAASYIVAADAEAAVSRHDLNPAAHAANVGLERTSRRGAKGGYAPLGEDSKVPLDNLPPISSGPHASTHENNGTDEISVAGLSGKLADAQDPTAHAASHGLAGADPILSAEYTSRKGAAGGYAGLDETSKVPAMNLGGESPAPGTPAFLGSDRTWKVPTVGTPSAHKTSHQKDGTDEISVEGLSGVLANAQVPKQHSHSHELNGADAISIAGLFGKSATAQTPEAHKANHQKDGADTISIAGLSGLAADAQRPTNHGATHGLGGGDDISIGGLSGMPAAAGSALGLATLDPLGQLTAIQTPAFVEVKSNRGAANGYAPLGADSKVPAQNLPANSVSKVFISATDTTKHVYTGNSENHLFLIQMGNQFSAGDHIVFRIAGTIVRPVGSGYLTFLVRRTHQLLHFDTATCTVTIPADPSTYGFNHEIRLVCSATAVIGYANFFSLVRGYITDLNIYPWNPADPDTLELLIINEDGETTTVAIAQVSVEKM